MRSRLNSATAAKAGVRLIILTRSSESSSGIAYARVAWRAVTALSISQPKGRGKS